MGNNLFTRNTLISHRALFIFILHFLYCAGEIELGSKLQCHPLTLYFLKVFITKSSAQSTLLVFKYAHGTYKK